MWFFDSRGFVDTATWNLIKWSLSSFISVLVWESSVPKFVAFSMADECVVSDFTAMCFEEEVSVALRALPQVDWKVEGRDPLHWAIKGFREDRRHLIAELIKAGSPVDGHALYLAGRFHPSLLANIPDPNVFTPSNARAIDNGLLDAARTGRSDDILRFLRLGANPETADYYHGHEGWNSLHLVCDRCDWEAFQSLLTVFISIHRLTNDGKTALDLLALSEVAKKNPEAAAKIRVKLEERKKRYPT